ncbi:multidrug efflux pump [Lachnospiraceae bacterium PF1-21]|uniref:Multidrug export protein MepA n=1 Tax=Ohessyouella blattaphilus TaxID=2949333 RepID=A0ABT1EEP4_9FIRM|nr:MATE family efflux transporter [Ohessyouella blattaphilus]MCP1108964.1 MATE family efflux transporter [Ohessyouella blattaphilus]MCR8562358.1 MATE family efflux transporter [Ohessyouella blattaphilus]
MKKTDLKSEALFAEKSVWKAIFSLAIPSCITILIMVFYNLADMFFIGQLGSTAQVAAVSIVGPVFSLAVAVATMLGIGGSSVIASTAGSGKLEDARALGSLCFYTGIALGLICTIVMLLGGEPLLKLLGASEATKSYASEYLRMLALGAPMMILSTTLPALLRSDGAIKEGLLGNLLGTMLNIILDPVFIFTLDLGVSGAAIATVIGNTVSTIVYVTYIIRKGQILGLNPLLAMKNIKLLWRVMAIGLPNGISSILSGFASSFANNLLASYSVNAVAAMAAAGKVSMIISMLQMGICMGVAPMLAYNYGAGKIARLQEIIKKLSLLTVIVGTLSTLICILGRGELIGLFLKESSARRLGEELVVLLVLVSPLLGFYYLSTNFLQATGKAMLATIVSLLRQGIILMPALFLLERLLGVPGIGLAYPVADGLSVGAALILLLGQLATAKKRIEAYNRQEART